MEAKKLKKSKSNRMVCGVCGGIAEYCNMDPTIIRLLTVFLAFTTSGIILYIIAAIIMPEEY